MDTLSNEVLLCIIDNIERSNDLTDIIHLKQCNRNFRNLIDLNKYIDKYHTNIIRTHTETRRTYQYFTIHNKHVLHGDYIKYKYDICPEFPNVIYIKQQYMCGTRVGKYTRYYLCGFISKEYMLNNRGEKHGEYIKYDNRAIFKHYNYYNGNKHGICNKYKRQIQSWEYSKQYQYVYGVKHGQMLWWYDMERSRIYKKYNYYNGILCGTCTDYYENGNIFRQCIYDKDRQLYITYEFHDNNILSRHYYCKYINGIYTPHGCYKRYNKAGLIESISHYNYGKLHGSQRIYDNNGALIAIHNYNNGEDHGRQILYINGKILSVLYYYNSFRHGIYKYYRSNKLYEIAYYNNGILVKCECI